VTGPLAAEPVVDVVILTWNDGQLLDRAVASVIAGQDVDVRLFVVDNGSDPPASVVDDPRIVLDRSPANLGVAGGRNRGIGLGQAPFVLLLDSDAELVPGSLSALLAPLLADAGIGLSAPVFVDQEPSASAGRAPTVARKAARLLGFADTYASATDPSGPWWEVEVAIGACQLFRREAYERVSGIDEAYFYGPEDVDFCMRVGAAGWTVVQVADAPVIHPARRRHRQVFTKAGARHAWAVTRFLWRHRRLGRRRAPVAPVRAPKA
jgi:N-acetylglucosaminyl-diphospho-decaprenol L-rhamnosyltransferase